MIYLSVDARHIYQILSRFTHNEFNLESESPTGVDFAFRMTAVDSRTLRPQIWSPPCSLKCFHQYYCGAVGALLIYDIANHATYINLTRWLQEIYDYGNKSYLEHLREVPTDETNSFAGGSFMDRLSLESLTD